MTADPAYLDARSVPGWEGDPAGYRMPERTFCVGQRVRVTGAIGECQAMLGTSEKPIHLRLSVLDRELVAISSGHPQELVGAQGVVRTVIHRDAHAIKVEFDSAIACASRPGQLAGSAFTACELEPLDEP